jgi:hypothetical protein
MQFFVLNSEIINELINQWAQSVRANFELRSFLFGHQHKKTLSYNILNNAARDILLYSPEKIHIFRCSRNAERKEEI